MTPFFSIIIPAYNVEKYISNTIDSIINQNFQDFELIIIEDCSGDNTLNIISDYEKKYKNIKIIKHTENQTQHIARINGVNAAKGKYILFLDGDDAYRNNAFSMLNNIIQKNSGYDFYEFGYIRKPSNFVVYPSYYGKDRFSDFFSKNNIPVHTIWNKVYESNVLKKAFSCMEKIIIKQGVEDLYESIVISYFSKKTMNIKKIFINYTIGSGVSTTYKDYDTTVKYLTSIKMMFNLIDIFIKKENLNLNMNNIYYRYLYIVTYYFNTQKNKEDKKKLYLMLLDYFDKEIVMEYFSNIESNILQSKDYKIGHIILKPLRKIKSFFKRRI